MYKTQINRDFVYLFGLIILISLLGLIAIFNASVIEGFTSFNDKFHFVKQQSIWLTIGLSLFLGIYLVPVDFMKKIALPLFLISLFCMVIVLIPGLGLKLQGARRWLSLGFIGFQPSEFLKVALILYLSVWFKQQRGLWYFTLLLGICLTLIMLQPDLGTAVIVATLGFGMYYLSGSNLKHLLVFVLILTASILVLIFSSPYRRDRVKTFLDPTSDPQGKSYHINQVLLGLGSGGWFGVGLGRSRQKYAYLPEATTDSIFSIIGEETGFVGGTFYIAALLALTLLAFKISSQSRNLHQRLLSGGVGILIGSQTIVNLASMVALVPLTGVPLPLISYGGSSVIVNFVSLGILASTTRHK